MNNDPTIAHATTHTTEQLVSAIFSKVVALMGKSKAEGYVWEAAFRQAVIEATVRARAT